MWGLRSYYKFGVIFSQIPKYANDISRCSSFLPWITLRVSSWDKLFLEILRQKLHFDVTLLTKIEIRPGLAIFAHVWPWMTFVDLETNFVEKISSRAPFWGIIRDIVWDFGQKFNFNIFSLKLAQLCKKTCFIWIRFDRNSSTGHYR